jgi:hypothetical protein
MAISNPSYSHFRDSDAHSDTVSGLQRPYFSPAPTPAGPSAGLSRPTPQGDASFSAKATIPGLKSPGDTGSASLGHLTLVPGSTADTIAKAAGGFKERYNAPPTGLKIISPDNPLSMQTFTPPARTSAAAPATAGNSPAANMPPIGSTNTAPGMHLIEPSNPASMAIKPPSANVTVPSPVIGTFNGRDITRADAEAIAARLPTAALGTPVAMGPNGSFAFSPPGGPSASAPPGSLASEASAVPSFAPPSVDTNRVRDAEQERAEVAKAIDDRIAALSFGPGALNSRGKRQLYAELVGQRAGLAKQAGDLAGASETSQRQSGTTLAATAASEAGALDRVRLEQEGETARNLTTNAAANLRAMLKPPEYVTDKDGNVNFAAGSTFAPVTDAKGNALRTPVTKAEGAITPAVQLDALVKQLQAEQGYIQPDPARVYTLQQQIAALAAPPGNAPDGTPLTQGGRKFVMRNGQPVPIDGGSE